MTDFETEVYSRSGEDVIGARVIVSANNGQQIDSIQVTNKTQFDELKDKLNTLNEDYVQFNSNSVLGGKTIDTILANVTEFATINATTLGGLQSDQYAKTAHTHDKQDITDLYEYDLKLSEYNCSVNEFITATLTVKKSNGNPAPNHSFVIYKDGANWRSGRTNNSGVFTTLFQVEKVGLTTFSVNNLKVQLFAKPEWKKIVLATMQLPAPGSTEEESLVLYVNEYLRLCSCKVDVRSFTNWSNSTGTKDLYQAEKIIPSQYCPIEEIRAPNYRGDVVIWANKQGQIRAYSLNKFASINLSTMLMWHY